MDYEQKYKEALERARQFSEHPLQEDSSDIVEYIFPELNENEDGRIKKAIIGYIDHGQHYGVSNADMIAWLEKQGKEEYALKSSRDEDVHKFMQYIEKQAKAYEFNLPNRGYDIYAFAKDILYWLEKQGESQGEQEIEGDDKDVECLLSNNIFDGRRFSNFEISSEYVKAGDIVLEGDGLNFKYRILTKVDGKHWEYFENGYYFSTSPEYCHWLVKGQKNCSGELIKIIY